MPGSHQATNSWNARWNACAKTPDVDYYAYLSSDGWRCRRALIRERDGGKCLLCNSQIDLHTHHWSYAHVGYENPEDLALLCSHCHQTFHQQWHSNRSSGRSLPPSTFTPPPIRPPHRSSAAQLQTAPPKSQSAPWFRQKRVWFVVIVLALLIIRATGGSGDPSPAKSYSPPRATATRPALVATQSRAGAAPTRNTGPHCDPAYPTLCIPSPPPVIDCGYTPARNFPVLWPDPQNLDRDKDGIGCEPILP